ncbi:hypothetical protein P175DRAFT_0522753 [Aspergillus ochraceoroseus IBT 24754]|uniref:Uncharacterized protein n=3 Tax=Aspergillus subgen. Nidulantes TaxID=2720870 RepID=A0A2T5LYX5_9EURO|nr:uncharacterized protein P175DRAFT_0522753 [Aspergillus ochraceoroseus IBT 24754]PTU21472.1 hypothetical protein P175DRAFT_0522753 [Aspergillus ochraceoroseus IBT 24754]
MNSPQCHGPCLSASAVRNSSVMRSPFSSDSPSDVSTEAGTSHQGVVHSPEQQPSLHLNLPSSSLPRSLIGSSRLKRRASQGSILTKPSTVSRFLTRSSAALHPPTLDTVGLSTRIESPSSDLRISTSASSASSSLAARASQSTSALWDPTSKTSDYPSNLPPTPPSDDEHSIAWSPRNGMLLFESPMNREPGPTPMDEGPNMDNTSGRGHSDSIGSPSERLSNASSSSSGDSSPRSSGDMDCDHPSWLENGVQTTVSSLPFSDGRGEAVKIVSQMLPYPCPADKSTSSQSEESVFCSIIQAVQHRLQHGQSPYVNITHAVPEQFNVSNLPHSPPNTPRPLFPTDDYFRPTAVFSSAAVVSAYHDFRGPIQAKSPHFPVPVVPPFSVHVSVLERYLPPSSYQEYKDLFSPHRPSFLVDRLSELSPDGGSLLFIYPTRRGASTFKSQYLGPILDPLLRQLVVVNELSAEISRYLGKVSSVAHMDDFDTMRENLERLCCELSSSSSRFDVVDARKGSIRLDRKLWTEWYIHQDKARMKEVISLYWQNSRRLPAAKSVPNTATNYLLEGKEVTSAMLLSDILDGIRRRPYGEEMEPRDGIELGVFVVRRSH